MAVPVREFHFFMSSILTPYFLEIPYNDSFFCTVWYFSFDCACLKLETLVFFGAVLVLLAEDEVKVDDDFPLPTYRFRRAQDALIKQDHCANLPVLVWPQNLCHSIRPRGDAVWYGTDIDYQHVRHAL